jgi:NadR type nicotinamide-nucleotide adenylyltransferase
MEFTYQTKLKGKSVGIMFGSFAPLHQGHLDCIMRAKKENDGGCLLISCGYDGDKGEPLMPHRKRYRYVREFFANDDLVAVYAINDTEIKAAEYPNGWRTWMDEFERIYKQAVEYAESRVWYVGDRCYYNDLQRMGEKVILLDREVNLVSGTMIRNNPLKYWSKITLPFRRVFSYNVLICGTASEGKSTLTADLGKYFNAPYSTEYARDYMIESNVADWELDGADFSAFLTGQYNLNKKLINSPQNNGVFFADSDSLVTKMYAEHYAEDNKCILTKEEYDKVAILANELTAKCKWDKIYLLCPKGKFVDDHSRYMAHSSMSEREALFKKLVRNLKENGLWDKVVILDGGYYNNFTKVVGDIKEILGE